MSDRCQRFVLEPESRHALLNQLASEGAAHAAWDRKFGMKPDYTTAEWRAGRGEKLTAEDRDDVTARRPRMQLEWSEAR